MSIAAATDRSNKFQHLLSQSPDIGRVSRISAGKFRRYPNQTFFERILDVKTIALNLRDMFRVTAGIVQAYALLGRDRPDVIFIKGGFVGVPIGIAARAHGVPFITHDSDTVPGLANRIIGRWADRHAVGMSEQFYAYPAGKTVQVGIPTSKEFVHVTDALKKAYRQDLQLPAKAKVIFVMGGSQGAGKLNQAINRILKDLNRAIPDLYVLHQTGRLIEGLPEDSDSYRKYTFIDELYKYSGAADVVVTRAGASSMAELAVQGRAAIVIPAPHLAGGHQIENGRHLAENKAAVIIDEADLDRQPQVLAAAIEDLVSDTKEQKALATNLAQMYKTNAAHEIAGLLIALVKSR